MSMINSQISSEKCICKITLIEVSEIVIIVCFSLDLIKFVKMFRDIFPVIKCDGIALKFARNGAEVLKIHNNLM